MTGFFKSVGYTTETTGNICQPIARHLKRKLRLFWGQLLVFSFSNEIDFKKKKNLRKKWLCLAGLAQWLSTDA